MYLYRDHSASTPFGKGEGVDKRSRLKEIFQSAPTHSSPDEILLCLWNKNFITEIYRKIQAFTFRVFQECGSWPSRNDAVQMLFLTPNRNMFAGKFVKSERVLAVAGAICCQCQVS